ncbi:hypothetical protein OG21DRAFT_1489305 [Imleria badia]|nr:hypothetical protein OG21DRAFT_1489305 [Imleria badia]
MSSVLQSALTSIQQNNYGSHQLIPSQAGQYGNFIAVALITVVGYDYALTFFNEIEYIWNKRWTWVSTLFVIVRYGSLLSVTIISLEGTSFIPGSAKTYVFCKHTHPRLSCLTSFRMLCLQGGIIYIIAVWTFILFLGAADLAMILRVWAMYNRSKLILRILLILFSLEIIFGVLAAAIYSFPRDLSAATIQVLDFPSCAVQLTTPTWSKVAAILQITHAAVMCILAIIQGVRQSLQMYSVTKQWQLNRYMILLVRQGVLYFFAVFLFTLLNVLAVSGDIPAEGLQADVLFILENVPMYTLTPRFILSIRELYAREVQGRRGGGIDSGFGLSLSSRDAGGTEIVFADVEQNEGSGDVEEIPMEFGTT